MTKRALITGITGQDGSYLAEYLLELGYEVFGLIRRSSVGPNFSNIKHIVDDLNLLDGDMTDADSLRRAVHDSNPNEVYNLAAQSFVPMSWTSPSYTNNVNFGGFIYLLEAVKVYNAVQRFTGDKGSKVYQASTSEMFGNTGVLEGDLRTNSISLNEDSLMRPRSPYGLSKLASHRLAQVYRESFGMFVCSGICFNHESPRRGEMFVTRKITKAVAAIHVGKQDKLVLGDIHARRDWGFAGDYIRAMWLMLQQSSPHDYVIGTGVTHSVEDVVVEAFKAAASLAGGNLSTPWYDYIKKDKKYIRPAEIFTLRADAIKARERLGWRPTVSFEALIHMMVKHDLEQEGVI